MTNKRIQLSTNVDGQNVNVYPVTKSEFVEFSDGKTLNDKLNNMDGNHEHGLATPAKDGFMSKEDKAKLDGVNNYTHPSTHAATMITEDATHRFVTDAEKTKWDNKADTTMASKTNAGLMSASDKQRIDGLNAEFKTRDDKITKNTEDIKSWNDEMINKEYQYFNGEDITIDNSIVSKTTDMVIKGRTLQNLWKTKSTSDAYWFKVKSNLSKLVNNDTITLIVNGIDLTKYRYRFGTINNESDAQYNVLKDYTQDRIVILNIGNSVNPSPDLPVRDCLWLSLYPLDSTVEISDRAIYSELKIIVLRGDYSNKSIPQYFEGIKSLGEEEKVEDKYKINILSHGKNLININNFEIVDTTGSIDIKTINESISIKMKKSQGWTTAGVFKLKVKPNTDYIFGRKIKVNTYGHGDSTWGCGLITIKENAIQNARSLKEISNPSSDFPSGKGENIKTVKFNTGNCNYIGIFIKPTTSPVLENQLADFIISDLFLYESNNDYKYKIYKEYRKDILIKEPLRSIGNIQDILYKDNGKVKIDKYIHQYNFTGDENFKLNALREDYVRFIIDTLPKCVDTGNSKIFSNNFPSNGDSVTKESVFGYKNAGIVFCILKSKLTTLDVNGFKAWLKANPTTIVYELDKPTTEVVENCVDIDLKTFNERTYITSDNIIKGDLSFTVPINTAANLENNTTRLNTIEDYVDNNKDNITKISKLEEGAVTSSLNIIDLQKEIKDDNYTNYKGNSININSQKNSRTCNMIVKGETVFNAVVTPMLNKTYNGNSTQQMYDYKVIRKPNTLYTIIALVSQNTLNHNFSLISWGRTDNGQPIVINREEKGLIKRSFTTNTNTESFFFEVWKEATSGSITIDYIMILEGDWTNKQAPNYFKGIKSFGEKSDEQKYVINLLSSGKNLYLDKDIIISKPENKWRVLDISIPRFEIGKKYRLSYSCNYDVELKIILTYADGHDGYISSLDYIRIEEGRGDITRVRLYIEDSVYNTNKKFIITNIQIEEGITASEYNRYKEDKKIILAKEPLRSIKESKDILHSDNSKVKISRYIGEHIFTGNETMKEVENNSQAVIVSIAGIKGLDNREFISNQNIGYDVRWDVNEWENNYPIAFNFANSGNGNIVLLFSKTKMPSITNIEAVKQYLRENKLQIVYKLAEPVVETLENYSDINLTVFKDKTYVTSSNSIKGEISFNIPNNLISQNKENTDNLNKGLNSINSINDKTCKLEEAQLSTALNVLELQKHTAMLSNGEINDYKDHIGVFVECDNTLDSRTERMIIRGKTLHNIHKVQAYKFGTNLSSECYTVTSGINFIDLNLKTIEQGKYYYLDAGYVNFNLLKSNTKYTIFCEGDTTGCSVQLMSTGYNNFLSTASSFVNNRAVITTNDLSNGWKDQIVYVLLPSSPKRVIVKNVIIIEGEINERPGYFEGIKSIGEAEYNYISEDEIKIGYIGGPTADTYNIPGSDDGTRTAVMQCEPNTTYTINKEFVTDRFVAGTTNVQPTNGTKVTKIDGKFLNGKSLTITTGNDAKYLLVYLTMDYKQKHYGKVNINKCYTPIEWSNCKKCCINIISNSKNLFNENESKVGLLNVNTGELFATNESCTSEYIKVFRNKKYIISGDGEIRTYYGVFYNLNKQYVSHKSFTKNSAITFDEDGYFRFSYASSNDTSAQAATNIMMREEKESTSYEEYKGDKTKILLKEPLRDSDYLCEINKKIKAFRHSYQYTFDGQENWTLWTNSTGNTVNAYVYFNRMSPDLSNIIKPDSKCINDRLPSNQGGHLSTIEGFKITSQYFAISVDKNKLGATNVNDSNNSTLLKKWLNENPLTMICERILPEIENIESVDINVDTYKDKTYITTDNEIQGELEFKTQNNFGAIMNNVNRCISKIFNSLNNILNIKGE